MKMTKLMAELKNRFAGKKILIVGLGLQGGGVGLAKFFARLGAKITVTDKKTPEQLKTSVDQLKNLDVNFRLGGHKIEDFLTCDVIFKGPSVRWDQPELVAAQQKNIPVEMEMSFFAALCPGKIIGVTGTRGKSTTTMMIYKLLQENGLKVHLAGNLPSLSTINLLHKIHKQDWVVMELASWPLSGFHRRKISPHIAVFTNFYPDHLNYYKNMDDYLFDKKAIYLYQKPEDHLVINDNLKSYIAKDSIRSKIHFFNSGLLQSHELHLRGVHNSENAAAAITVANILKLDLFQCFKTLKNFKGLPHRQEILAEKDGIIFVNDTTSTTPVATQKAIDTFSQHDIVLILGGTSKNLPLTPLLDQLATAKKIVLLKGSFTAEIMPILQNKYPSKITPVYDDLNQAINVARKFAKQINKENHKKVVVLFSPGAPSFAMFNNEFHRGEEFNRIVRTSFK